MSLNRNLAEEFFQEKLARFEIEIREILGKEDPLENERNSLWENLSPVWEQIILADAVRERVSKIEEANLAWGVAEKSRFKVVNSREKLAVLKPHNEEYIMKMISDAKAKAKEKASNLYNEIFSEMHSVLANEIESHVLGIMDKRIAEASKKSVYSNEEEADAVIIREMRAKFGPQFSLDENGAPVFSRTHNSLHGMMELIEKIKGSNSALYQILGPRLIPWRDLLGKVNAISSDSDVIIFLRNKVVDLAIEEVRQGDLFLTKTIELRNKIEHHECSWIDALDQYRKIIFEVRDIVYRAAQLEGGLKSAKEEYAGILADKKSFLEKAQVHISKKNQVEDAILKDATDAMQKKFERQTVMLNEIEILISKINALSLPSNEVVKLVDIEEVQKSFDLIRRELGRKIGELDILLDREQESIAALLEKKDGRNDFILKKTQMALYEQIKQTLEKNVELWRANCDALHVPLDDKIELMMEYLGMVSQSEEVPPLIHLKNIVKIMDGKEILKLSPRHSSSQEQAQAGGLQSRMKNMFSDAMTKISKKLAINSSLASSSAASAASHSAAPKSSKDKTPASLQLFFYHMRAVELNNFQDFQKISESIGLLSEYSIKMEKNLLDEGPASRGFGKK